MTGKLSPKLTINLGLRWDFFGLVYDTMRTRRISFRLGLHGGRCTIIPPMGLMLGDSSVPASPILLAADGIALAITNKYGKGLGKSQKANFAPRFGFAYQVTRNWSLVADLDCSTTASRTADSPEPGENYPFQFNFQYAAADDGHPITYPGCTAAAPHRKRHLGNRFRMHPARSIAGQCQRTRPARNPI